MTLLGGGGYLKEENGQNDPGASYEAASTFVSKYF